MQQTMATGKSTTTIKTVIHQQVRNPYNTRNKAQITSTEQHQNRKEEANRNTTKGSKDNSLNRLQVKAPKQGLSDMKNLMKGPNNHKPKHGNHQAKITNTMDEKRESKTRSLSREHTFCLIY